MTQATMTETSSTERKSDYMYFISEAVALPGTTMERLVGGLIGRRTEDVKDDWRTAVGDAADLVSERVRMPDSYALDEIHFHLGFSAGGQLAFIADTDVQPTVTIVFKRTE